MIRGKLGGFIKGIHMDSSKTLQETVERAKREVEALLAEVHAPKPDRAKMEHRLREVEGNLRTIDIHLHKPGGG